MRAGRAFTMVELVVVVVIISVLALIIVPQFFGRTGEAKQGVAQYNISIIENAIQLFAQDYDRLPETLDELVERPDDVDEGQWTSPTLKRKNLIDPWSRPYVYRYPGDHGTFDLLSLGRDGQEGGEDEDADIVNW